MSIQVRYFLPEDYESIIELTKRLSEFDMPEWRQDDQINATKATMIKTAMNESELENALIVAEDEFDQKIVGYIRLQTQADFFSGEKFGYIAHIAVDYAVEGQGIGQKLLDTAETWTREKGYTQLKLHVFEENLRARQVYEKNGFQQDIIAYTKVIASNSQK